MKRSAIFKLVCALRQLTDTFDANIDVVSAKLLQAAETGNAAAQEFQIVDTNMGRRCVDWDSMLSHLIFASWGQWDDVCQRMKILISPAYASWKLKSLCSLGDDPDQECQQYHQLAQHLVGNAILQANH